MLDIFIGSHATVFFNRLAFLMHWAAFVVVWVASIHWLATADYAPIGQVLGKLLLQVEHPFEGVMMWSLPLFCTVDWLSSGKITIFPWKRERRFQLGSPNKDD